VAPVRSLVPLDSVPQNDADSAEASVPRSGWTTLIDEGTAGGW
jgi:hypothetical protein